MSKPTHGHCLSAAVSALLLLTAADVSAGPGMDQGRSSSVSASASAENKQPIYPDATRKAPAPSASSPRMTAKVQALRDEFKRQDALGRADVYPQLRASADIILADRSISTYERAVANMVGGFAADRVDDPVVIDYLTRAVEADALDNDDHFQSMLMLAQALSKNDPAKALALLERFESQTRTQDPTVLLIKGNVLNAMGRYRQSIVAIQQAIARFGAADGDKKRGGELLLASVYISAGQMGEADTLIDAMLAERGSDSEGMALLVMAYLANGKDPAKAIALGDKVLAKNPGNAPLRLTLAQIYLRGRRVDDAIALMDELNAAGRLDDGGRQALLGMASDAFEGPSAPAAKFADALLATNPGDAALKARITELRKASGP
ncbi:MAG: tetratricopeptide repeat protein [Lysobacter sp.]|nr:tetratricopeptide repeat protein [Lysobacter sp.]